MANLEQVRRVVYGHSWQDLAEWAASLEQLADLTDEEIDRIAVADVPKAPRRTQSY